MAHQYFNDPDTPSIYGTRKRKSPAVRRKRLGNPVDFQKAKRKISTTRTKMKTTRKSGSLAKLGKMHERTSDPFGRK